MRSYFRCLDSLLPVAIDAPPEQLESTLVLNAGQSTFLREECGGPAAVICSICGGEVEFLGQVQSFPDGKAESPCNGSCTDALGPVCDCSCGGRNHGTGMLGALVDGGAAIAFPRGDGDHAKRAAEYRDARGRAMFAFDRLYGRPDGPWRMRASGALLAREDVREYNRAATCWHRFRGVLERRSWHGRQARLEALVQEFLTAIRVAGGDA